MIVSPLSVETCQARLREALAPPLGAPRASSVAGRVDGNVGRLRKRTAAGRLSPSLITFRMETAGETTRLSCRARPDDLPPWLLGLFIVALLSPIPFIWGRWFAILPLAAMAVRFGLDLSQALRPPPGKGRDDEFLLLFLARVTEGVIQA